MRAWSLTAIVCALLLLCAVFWKTGTATERFVDFSSRWKPAQCAMEKDVALRAAETGMDAFQRKLDALWHTAGTSTCPGDVWENARGSSATTRDAKLDETKSLIFLDHHHMSCTDKTGLRGFKYMPNDETLAANWTCENSQKTNSHRTFRTGWAHVAQGVTPHVADCGDHPVSSYGFESDGDERIRLRYDCATGIRTDSPMRFYNGWLASVDTTARTNNMSLQCPSGTVLTRLQFRNCDATSDDTAVFTCARPAGTTSAADAPDPVKPPASVAEPKVELTLKQELDLAFDDTRRNFANAGSSMRGVIVEGGKGSWRVMKAVGGIFTGAGKGVVDGFNAFTGRMRDSGKRFVKGASFTKFRSSFQDMRLIGAAFPRVGQMVGKGMQDGWLYVKDSFTATEKAIDNAEDAASSVGSSFTTAFRAIRDSFPTGWREFKGEVDRIKTDCFEKRWKEALGT